MLPLPLELRGWGLPSSGSRLPPGWQEPPGFAWTLQSKVRTPAIDLPTSLPEEEEAVLEPSSQPARLGLGQGRAWLGQRQAAAVGRPLAAAWSCGSRVTWPWAAQRRDRFPLWQNYDSLGLQLTDPDAVAHGADPSAWCGRAGLGSTCHSPPESALLPASPAAGGSWIPAAMVLSQRCRGYPSSYRVIPAVTVLSQL